MKRVIIKYTLLLTLIGFVLVFLAMTGINAWVSFVILIPGLAIAGLLLYNLTQLIKIDDATKKYAIYICVFIGELIVLTFFSVIFRESNLMSVIGANILFVSVCVMLVDVVKTTQNVRMEIGCLLQMCIFISIVLAIINNIIFFVLIAQ